MITEILKQEIIERNKYLQEIQDFLWTPLIKVLIWSRRVGKSSILKNIILMKLQFED